MYDELLTMLYALKYSIADTHYWVKGASFYGNHKFADWLRYGDDDHLLSDYIDSINEVCYLGSEQLTPYSKNIVGKAIEMIAPQTDDEEEMFKNISDLIYKILSLIEDLMPKASCGEANLLGNIAQDLQQRYGLLWRRLK